MGRLTQPMQHIIRNFSAGAVATVNADGSPAVSPKATFVIVDEGCLAFGHIRSPQTCANLRLRPRLEVCFTDVLARLAVRVTGRGTIVDKQSDRGRELRPHFEALWSAYLDRMQAFVEIEVERAELIQSPAYDVGLTRDELVRTNLEKLNRLE